MVFVVRCIFRASNALTLKIVLYISCTKGDGNSFLKHKINRMHMPTYWRNGSICMEFHSPRFGLCLYGDVLFMPDTACGKFGYGENQNGYPHSASAGDVKKFFETSTVTVGDILKRISEFSVNHSQGLQLDGNYANCENWVFMIASKVEKTYKTVHADLPFLQIPSRFFTSEFYKIVIVTNPFVFYKNNTMLPGTICISDMSYFET